MHRNASAPTLDDKNGKKFDPFADFLASSGPTEQDKASPTTNARSVNNSGRSTPSSNVQRFATQQVPQDRRNFDSFFNSGSSSTTGVGPKFGESAFDDILSSQGFSSTAKNAQRSLASIRREEDAKVLDPITLKVNFLSAK